MDNNGVATVAPNYQPVDTSTNREFGWQCIRANMLTIARTSKEDSVYEDIASEGIFCALRMQWIALVKQK